MRLCIRIVSLALVLSSLGCASAARVEPESSARCTPPRMISAVRPDLRFDARTSSIRAVDMRIQVLIDANGRPDLSTLQVTGRGATENRDIVAEWLRMSAF